MLIIDEFIETEHRLAGLQAGLSRRAIAEGIRVSSRGEDHVLRLTVGCLNIIVNISKSTELHI